MPARVLSLCFACLTLASSAPARDLFAFSRTANASANDSIGPAPTPGQVVNNVDRVGPVRLLVNDPTSDILNMAQGYAEANFGHLRVRAGGTSRDGLQKTASADSAFQDTLTMSGMGTAGASYRFAGSFMVTGSTSYVAPTGLSVINVAYSWNAYQDAGATRLGGDLRRFERNSSGGGFVGTDFLGSVLPIEFDFVWGGPVILEMTLGAGIGANSLTSTPASFAHGSVLMGDSLTWLGASITEIGGAPVTATIVGDSGTDWVQPTTVPEPALIALVAIGFAASALRRMRP